MELSGTLAPKLINIDEYFFTYKISYDIITRPENSHRLISIKKTKNQYTKHLDVLFKHRPHKVEGRVSYMSIFMPCFIEIRLSVEIHEECKRHLKMRFKY